MVRPVQLAAAWVWCLRWLRRIRLQVRQSCCFCTFLLPAEVNTAVDLLETRNVKRICACCAATQAALAAQHAAEQKEHAAEQKAAQLAAQLQELQAKQTVEAEARAAGLQIGARIYQQGSGGQIVVAEVVRYDGQKVVCRCVCRDTLLTTTMPFLDSIRPPRLLLLLRLFPLQAISRLLRPQGP